MITKTLVRFNSREVCDPTCSAAPGETRTGVDNLRSADDRDAIPIFLLATKPTFGEFAKLHHFALPGVTTISKCGHTTPIYGKVHSPHALLAWHGCAPTGQLFPLSHGSVSRERGLHVAPTGHSACSYPLPLL